ncbi:hypothetical protein N3K66_004226 [Trichothecium roseum]|uniref:Uncharacterized protein n=1 Tax=Trichothecium roseum TaxID=47278 RepID=A0ACC0V0M6_9HYPO|nr:hypothetical protein N3K66_004226 [Trichothecium roseum]
MDPKRHENHFPPRGRSFLGHVNRPHSSSASSRSRRKRVGNLDGSQVSLPYSNTVEDWRSIPGDAGNVDQYEPSPGFDSDPPDNLNTHTTWLPVPFLDTDSCEVSIDEVPEQLEWDDLDHTDVTLSYPLLDPQSVGVPSDVNSFDFSRSRNQVPSDTPPTNVFSSSTGPTSRAWSGPPDSWSVTTPYHIDYPSATRPEEPTFPADDYRAIPQADLPGRTFDLEGISQPAPLPVFPRDLHDADFRANVPRGLLFQEGTTAIERQFLAGWSIPPFQHPFQQTDYISQPINVCWDQHLLNQPQQEVEVQGPSSGSGTFSDDLLLLFKVKTRTRADPMGTIPCFMCRQKFTKHGQSVRHMEQCHILHKVWICADCDRNKDRHQLLRPDLFGCGFNRRDNFISHLGTSHEVAGAERKNELAAEAEAFRCPLPDRLYCSVPGCTVKYEHGANVLHKLLKHVTRDHAAVLETNVWRDALLPYLRARHIVVQESTGLRPATYEDVPPGELPIIHHTQQIPLEYR